MLNPPLSPLYTSFTIHRLTAIHARHATPNIFHIAATETYDYITVCMQIPDRPVYFFHFFNCTFICISSRFTKSLFRLSQSKRPYIFFGKITTNTMHKLINAKISATSRLTTGKSSCCNWSNWWKSDEENGIENAAKATRERKKREDCREYAKSNVDTYIVILLSENNDSNNKYTQKNMSA